MFYNTSLLQHPLLFNISAIYLHKITSIDHPRFMRTILLFLIEPIQAGRICADERTKEKRIVMNAILFTN